MENISECRACNNLENVLWFQYRAWMYAEPEHAKVRERQFHEAEAIFAQHREVAHGEKYTPQDLSKKRARWVRESGKTWAKNPSFQDPNNPESEIDGKRPTPKRDFVEVESL